MTIPPEIVRAAERFANAYRQGSSDLAEQYLIELVQLLERWELTREVKEVVELLKDQTASKKRRRPYTDRELAARSGQPLPEP